MENCKELIIQYNKFIFHFKVIKDYSLERNLFGLNDVKLFNNIYTLVMVKFALKD